MPCRRLFHFSTIGRAFQRSTGIAAQCSGGAQIIVKSGIEIRLAS
jgi:hypothetical protein